MKSKSLLKTGALAIALAAITWLIGPVLLPAKLPEDFPKLPDLATVNRSMREQLRGADREARRRSSSATGWTRLRVITKGQPLPPMAVPLCRRLSDSDASQRAAGSGNR